MGCSQHETRRTARARGIARTAVAVVVLAWPVLLAGCSGGTVAGTSIGSAPAASGTGSAGATKALATVTTQLRTTVTAMAEPMRASVDSREVTVDDAGPCEVGAATAWPRRWSYTLRLVLKTSDASGAARLVRDRLAAQGWTLRTYDTTSDATDFDARREGMTLHVMGDPNPAAVTIEGYSACVGTDGVIRR